MRCLNLPSYQLPQLTIPLDTLSNFEDISVAVNHIRISYRTPSIRYDSDAFQNLNLLQRMKSILLACLLVLELGFGQPTICLSDHHPSQLQLAQHPLKPNHDFTFRITHHPAPLTIIRNYNGTFFHGNFSTLLLTGYNHTFVYQAKSFSFKYPPQHKIAQLTQEVVEMQVIYELQQSKQRNWKNKRLVLSISFVATDYAPHGGFTLKQQIKPNLQNGTILSLQKLLPLVTGLNMVLYKGIHSQFPLDRSFLWVVRRELLLMSETEFETLKDVIFGHIQKEHIGYHGLLQKLSDLNEIRETQVRDQQFGKEGFAGSEL